MNAVAVIVFIVVVGLFVVAFLYSKKTDTSIQSLDAIKRITEDYDAKSKAESSRISSLSQEELRDELNKRIRTGGS